jgi:hypothetical protein
VFARWIAGVAGSGGAFKLARQHGRSKTNLRYLGLKSRALWKVCNNGWMSTLEQTVKPLLTPIIQEQPVVWSTPTEQVTVAR